VLVTGVWSAGGVVTNDFRTSIALTTVWFAVSGAVCLIAAWRAPALRLPVLLTYVVVATAMCGYLGLTTWRDRVVDERIVTGVPQLESATELPHVAAPPASNVELLQRAVPLRRTSHGRIPADVRLSGRSVVIWCRAFSAPFGSARLV
jgi:hypothetical protein